MWTLPLSYSHGSINLVSTDHLGHTFPTMADNEFRHERLKLSANSIRLLQVQGGTKKDTLSIRITQYAVHKQPPYAAISYMWGSEREVRQILVNGRPFRVRGNLWHLLMHLRQRGESRFLWIDALCIDQQNLQERNFHVQLMGQIYDRAETTLVWLGLPSENRREARAMEFVAEMATFLNSHPFFTFRDTYLTEAYVPRWSTLLELCRYPYWTRTWIIQEFLQARQVEAICGTANLPWKHFETVLNVIKERSSEPAPIQPVMDQFMKTLPSRLTARRLTQEESTLAELLSEFYDSKCTERRDKLYGILGIADDCGEDAQTGMLRGPRPDYSKHIMDVYFDVVEHLRRSSARGKLPLATVLLAQRSLGLGDTDVSDYITRIHSKDSLTATLRPLTCEVEPDYVNLVEEVLPGWTSIRDLRQRLEQISWGKYVGHQVRKKQSRPKKASIGPHSTEYVRLPLPADLIDNAVNVAHDSPDVIHLHNYPEATGSCLPPESILLHHEDKRTMNNPALQKPSIILEQSEAASPVRLGFACTDVRQGDLLCQFSGLDSTLIVRRANQGLKLVGKAVMINHVELRHQTNLHPAFAGSQWLSHCLGEMNDEHWSLTVDPLSLLELLTRG